MLFSVAYDSPSMLAPRIHESLTPSSRTLVQAQIQLFKFSLQLLHLPFTQFSTMYLILTIILVPRIKHHFNISARTCRRLKLLPDNWVTPMF